MMLDFARKIRNRRIKRRVLGRCISLTRSTWLEREARLLEPLAAASTHGLAVVGRKAWEGGNLSHKNQLSFFLAV